MYETLMHTLRAFFGAGLLRGALVGSVVVTVVVLAAHSSGTFRRALADARAGGDWRNALAGTGVGLFKFLLLFAVARGLIAAMTFQAQRFEHEHGRITERNRSAVLMKWGSPHEQRELDVTHTRKRVWVTRQTQVQVSGEEPRVMSESFWKDEEPPVHAVGGKMPVVISVQEEERDVPVDQKSIVSADVNVTVRNNPRTLGNANYAGYDDAWSLRYSVTNRSRWRTTARMSFPLPAQTGLFDAMHLRLDGQSILDAATSEQNAMVWSVEMAPGARHSVDIGYRSRGLEHLRYVPRRMTQTGHYRVALRIEGIPSERLDYPIGSMPPREDLAQVLGSAYDLTWDLDNALTSYDIGIKLPQAEQPAYHFATLLREAPVGLVILFALLVLPRLISEQSVRPGTVVLLGAAYFLHFTFMGRMADHMDGFLRPFALSAGAVLFLTLGFRLRDTTERRFLRGQDCAAFFALSVLYPLAIVDSDRTGFWMQLGYLLALAYLCAMLVCFRRMPARWAATAAPGLDGQDRR